jgi:uncharacterized protein
VVRSEERLGPAEVNAEVQHGSRSRPPSGPALGCLSLLRLPSRCPLEERKAPSVTWLPQANERPESRAGGSILTVSEAMASPMGHVSLTTLGVDDLERATRFYEHLGWQRSSASVAGTVSFLRGGVVVLALFGSDELAADAGVNAAPSRFARVAFAMNVASEDDVDQAFASAEQAGARITRPAARADWGGYSGYFSDPDGHLWEIAHNPGFALLPDGRVQLPDDRQRPLSLPARDRHVGRVRSGGVGGGVACSPRSPLFVFGTEGQMRERSQGISTASDTLAETALRLRPVVPG